MLQPKILRVETWAPMKLLLYYETGEVRLFDTAPYAKGSWFGELRNEDYFKSVHILPDGTGIEWANGQDIAPHELYDLSVPFESAG